MDAREASVNFLIVSSRYPWPPYTGDRLRTLAWIEALAPAGNVTLVTSAPRGNVTTVTPARVFTARRSAQTLLESTARAFTEGLPFHALIAAGQRWGEALRAAHEEVIRFDAAVVLLSRFEPWVRDRINARLMVLDAIDSLAESVAERSRHSRGPARVFWKREAERTRALEQTLGSRYDKVVVVSECEREFFGPKAVTIPVGVEIRPFDEGAPRDFDCAFWGRLGYFANRDAVRRLAAGVWPEVRAAHPQARLLIAGADAPREIAALDGSKGIEVRSPMEERPALLRRAEIALFPIRYGTGQSIKAMEAAEAGCAIVGTPAAVRGMDHLRPHAVLEDEPSSMAAAVAALLSDRSRSRELGSGARAAVVSTDDRTLRLKQMRALIEGVPA
jgi:polysaccharide biosynthesis protein PslH